MGYQFLHVLKRPQEAQFPLGHVPDAWLVGVWSHREKMPPSPMEAAPSTHPSPSLHKPLLTSPPHGNAKGTGVARQGTL